MKNDINDQCSNHEFCNCLTLCRDTKTMRQRKSFYDRKREEQVHEVAPEEKKTFRCNDEYIFALPQRDTLYDLCEQIYELGCTLVDSANNAERVANLRALEAATNELGFDCIDYLQDLGATDFDDDGEAFDAIVLPTKIGDSQ